MKITVTAHCTFCARKFNAVNQSILTALDSTRVVDGIVCDDADGRLCCDDCRCFMCGAGHATDAQFEECGEYADHAMLFGDFGQGDGFNVDAFRDRVLADRAGAL